MSNPRINKREREKAKREKAAAKAERRTERRSATDDGTDSAAPTDQSSLLAELEALHRRFEAHEIDFDDFAAQKEQITERLQIG
jgi:hypothetical protein